MFEQNNQAGDEIVDDRLQSKTDADTERTGDQRQVAKVQANRRQRDEQSQNDDEVMGKAAYRVQRSLCSAGIASRNPPKCMPNTARQEHRHEQDYEKAQDVAACDGRFSHGK